MTTMFSRQMARSVRFGLFVAFFAVSGGDSRVAAQDWESGEPAPAPAPAQAQGSEGAGSEQGSPQATPTTDPGAAPAQSGRPWRYEGMANPLGAWFAGGFEATGGGAFNRPWLRLEGGIPLGVGRAPGLSILLPLFFTRDREIFTDPFSGDEFGFEYVALAFLPGVRYEWLVYNGRGAVTVFAEGGAGVFFQHYETIDTAFPLPDPTDNNILGGFRVAGGGTYVLPFGLMFSLQPAGVLAAFGNGGGGADYEFSIMVGYRAQGG